ncbi:MAG: D-aminoacylase [Gemmatimonadaceae bacterium]|nr:D-aminoacylase [Gemmatimonadaceae bacterium]
MRRVLLAAALAVSACSSGPAGTTITNVRIIDGTGAPSITGAVRFIGDSIVAVGDVQPARGDSVIDGGGLVLAPGFIDTHSHHTGDLLDMPEALGAVSQGITTIVGGNDGGQPYPLKDAFDTLAEVQPSINVAYYAGHGDLRSLVMGEDFKRKATPAEVDSMAKLLQQELDAGALGLSTGLEYDPGIYSDRAEVLALAKVAATARSRYISHIRSEDRWFWDAIDEVIAIGREAKLPVQISHVKLAMVPLWGRADSLITLLEAARAAGVDVTADIYPYPYWHSTLTVLFPERDFSDRAEAQKVLREIAKPEGLLIGRFAADTSYQGRTVAELAVRRKEDPASTLMGLIRESIAYEAAHPGSGGESVVATSMDEPDIVRLMQWEHTNFCSDGALDGAHPRGFGSFTRVLGRYVREQRVMPLEQAIRQMTSLSAAHVGLRRRGTIAPGNYADLVLFDPATVIDNATPKAPHAVSTGIVRVWVNGATVWADGKTVRSRSGRGLRRQEQ